MSERGVISDAICRSSRRKTLRTIARSCSSMTPDSEPSLMSCWISSSVTAFSVVLRTPISRSSTFVDAESRRTKGLAILASPRIGRATRRAIPSADICPRRFGTSSPSTIEK